MLRILTDQHGSIIRRLMSGVVCFASLLVLAGTLVNGELLAELGS